MIRVRVRNPLPMDGPIKIELNSYLPQHRFMHGEQVEGILHCSVANGFMGVWNAITAANKIIHWRPHTKLPYI